MSNRYFRDRILVPLGIPVAVLVGVGFFIVNLSRVLLAVNKDLSVVVAIVVAVVILAGAAWAATRPRIARSTLVSLLVLLALAVGTTGAVAARHGERKAEMVASEVVTKAPSPSTPRSSAPAPAPSPAGPTNLVQAANLAFSPATITVPAGSTVTWKMADSQPHTVTSVPGDPLAFDSASKSPGQEFPFTFTKAGTYTYYCRFHGTASGQGMAGTVKVV